MIKILANGGIRYVQDEKTHRANGPAISWHENVGGEWYWGLFGNRHRYYGPAFWNGMWWVHNKRIKEYDRTK